jgi:hypothetical protein
MKRSSCDECGTIHGPDQNTLCPRSSVYKTSLASKLDELNRRLMAEGKDLVAQRDTALGACRALESELAAERKRLLELERTFATFAIEIGQVNLVAWPDAVVDLVIAHRGKAVDLCDRCHKRAPLMLLNDDQQGHQEHTCAWGCDVAPRPLPDQDHNDPLEP